MVSDDQARNTPTPGSREYWLDQRKNIDLIFWALVGLCGLLVVTQIVMDPFADYHVPSELFELKTWSGFYGVFGYVAFLGIVLAGKYLRKVVMREEDFYDR